MARVTAEEVRAIIETTATETQMQEYIFSAEVFIDSVFAGSSLSNNLMKEIERWITAHLIASSRDRQATEEGAGGAYVKYGSAGKKDRLYSTTYGQQAILLDPTGILDELSSKKKVYFYASKEPWQ
jgi:hypothetical protein